ncbi:MAG: BA14K family protein [Hyphomicrobium sp.]|nr:BA14K family protein [Hyphomicrobium sp.]
MRAFSFTRFTAALGVAALLATTAIPARAAPVPSSTVALKSALTSDIVDVRIRGRGGRGGAGIVAGIASGLILGGIIGSQQPYYGGYYGGPPAYYGAQPFYPPGYYGPVYGQSYGRSPDWISYCFSRYRSFDPGSGTYLGRDGRRHYCR